MPKKRYTPPQGKKNALSRSNSPRAREAEKTALAKKIKQAAKEQDARGKS